MAQINVVDLTFCYEDGFEPVFEHVSFSIDTNWKLGLIGRNGKGKTTFLNLLLKKYEYSGTISTSVVFDYFPYRISEEQLQQNASDFLEELKPGCEQWRVICELEKLHVSAELLYRPFRTLSHGERTKVMLAVLFSADNHFLLIDEPTNHLDFEGREIIKHYLSGKKGFLLVSHDRDLLDACVNHVLVLNRKTIEVQTGNFSSWQQNKQRQDQFAQSENEKHLREIHSLKSAADRTSRWASKSEGSKIGFDPRKEPDRMNGTRPYIGAKTKKMQARVKSYEKRMEREIESKEGLLQDIECPVELKLYPQSYHKERLLYARDLSLSYSPDSAPVVQGLSFEIERKERIVLHGANGCGKSTLIKAILKKSGKESEGNGYRSNSYENGSYRNDNYRNDISGNDDYKKDSYKNAPSGICVTNGELAVGSGLTISYINQDTSFLHGTVSDFCASRGLDESLFCALLRQLDLDRIQFAMHMEDFSEGQKKKVLIAASLMTPAHLYIWDEPLNYIDVFSRMQIENLILEYAPTMLIVEHDARFREKIATKIITIDGH